MQTREWIQTPSLTEEGLHISTSVTLAGEGQLPEVREAGAVPRTQQPGGVPRLVPGWGKDDDNDSDNNDNDDIDSDDDDD